MRRILFILFALLPLISYAQIEIQMERQSGGTFLVPCKVNGIPLKFIFDTGASEVCISYTEAVFMAKNGYLGKEDIKGSAYSQIANGDVVENTMINLKEIEIGGITLKNVSALVSSSINAPLLLGQSAIQKLGAIQLDGDKLIIKNGKNFKSDEEAWSYYQKGFQQFEAEDFKSAIASSEKGLMLTNDHKIRALLYDNMATSYFRLEQLDKAVEMCNKGLGEDLYNCQLGYNLAYFLYQSKKYTQSKNAFLQFVDKIPKYTKPSKDMLAGAYAYLGELQLRDGELKNAENSLLTSINYEENQQALLNLGDIYSQQKNYPSAISCYEKGISFEPNRLSNIKRYYQLGFCYIYNNDINNAINSFNKSISCFSYNQDVVIYGIEKKLEGFSDFFLITVLSNLELGRLYYYTKNYRESFDKYTHVLSLPDANNTFFEVRDFYTMAFLYSQYGSDEDIEEIINKGLEVHNNNPDLLFIKSLLKDDDKEEDIEIYKTILKQELTYTPFSFDYATVYNNLAWAYCLQGEYEEGLPFSLRSIQMDATHDYSWETLGEIYYYLGHYKECIDAMTKCIELSPNYKQAYIIRGSAKIQMGNKKDGEKDLKIAEKLSD